MKYLLDTNKLIGFFRGKQDTVELIAKIAPKGFAISAITLAEYLVGAYKSTNPKKNAQVFEDFLQKNNIPILVIDQTTAITYAQNMAKLEAEGRKLHVFDMLIAATALANDLILISDDKVFQRMKNLKLMS